MADHTHIEWTDPTWNVVTGCSVVSPGCTNCYAMRLAGGRMQHHPSRAGLTIDSKAGPVWNGQVRFNEAWLTQPINWRKPRRIFVAAHGDLFHEGVTDAQLDQILCVMAIARQHTYQVLTKRPERMRDYLAALTPVFEERMWATGLLEFSNDLTWPLANVWLGVSVEDQARADERVPILLETPAAVRWISAEPLLGPVNLSALSFPKDCDCLDASPTYDAFTASVYCEGCCEGPEPMTGGRLDWVVVGGESGPGARPMHPDWVRRIRDQCADAGVPFLFKQRGAWSWVTVEGDPDWDTIDDPPGPDDPPWRPTVLAPRDSCRLHVDGRREDDQGMAWPDREPRQMILIGKVAAGRDLDGVTHDGYPA